MSDTLRAIVDSRTLLAAAASAVLGAVLLRLYPFPGYAAPLAIIHWRTPWLYRAIAATYATVAFTSPFILLSMVGALAYVFAVRIEPRRRAGRLPAYPPPRARRDLFLVLGEVHHPTKPIPSRHPLAHPARARALHRRGHRGRHRDRQDQRVHVSLCRPVLRLPRVRSRRRSADSSSK